MNESYVTLQGWVGTDVDERVVNNGHLCASFRLGCTPRYQKDGVWMDGETSWYTVNCWRGLGRNVAASVRSGEPVVVHGRIRTDVWQRDKDSPKSVSLVVDASFVGHDLTRGTTAFTKAARPAPVDPVGDEGFKAFVHDQPADGPQLDADGNPVETAA